MKKPTAIELQEYAKEIGYFGFDHNDFLDHYEANGWKVGRTSMKDWKAAVRNWRRRESEFHRKKVGLTHMGISQRNDKINELNRRKAALLRQPDTPSVRRELEQIRIQLHSL